MMDKKTIPYKNTGYFSKTMCDYLDQSQSLQPFYHRFPSIKNFKEQIQEKSAHFNAATRAVLSEQLQAQYKGIAASEATQKNIESLKNDTTYTVTTGHQLNLFTGPLYFLYKIISVINLSEMLEKAYPAYHFVPVYWMATEDHDFEEINYFNFQGKKITWDRDSGGAVGELTTEGLQQVFIEFEKQLHQDFGFTTNAKHLLKLFKNAYLDHGNLTDATRYLGNELFKEYGLVIVDGNDSVLKQHFAPLAKKELLDEIGFKAITQTTKKLTAVGYGEQVHPREINLFYLHNGVRERIIKQDNVYYVNDTQVQFTQDEIVEELQHYPERFSPNALLRPLYQEVILPNICYTGGGGELAYWFQLKDYFNEVSIPFPILLLRNSALLVSKKAEASLQKLAVTIEDLFLPQEALKAEYTKKISAIAIDFSKQREHLTTQFKEMYAIAEKTDASFIGAVAAQEKKQLNGLDHLEKRLLKAQKRKYVNELRKLTNLQDTLFPKNSLQERNVNFAFFYLEYGPALIKELKKQLDPLAHQFTVITL